MRGEPSYHLHSREIMALYSFFPSGTKWSKIVKAITHPNVWSAVIFEFYFLTLSMGTSSLQLITFCEGLFRSGMVILAMASHSILRHN